jgi:hypothetical protein
MEVEASRRILKRPCTAQVVEAILLKEPPHFGGVCRRGLRGGQPTLDFGAKISKC